MKNNKNTPTRIMHALCYGGIFFGALYLINRGQDLNWDLLNYHFFAGYSLSHGRQYIDVAPTGIQWFLNPIINVFAYYSLRYFSFPYSALSIFAIQLVSLPAIVLLARAIGRDLGYKSRNWGEILAVILTLSSPNWIGELGTTFFSSWTAPLILWGIYLIYREKSNAKSNKVDLCCAGILLGLASGIKLTNAPFVIAATCSIFAITLNNKEIKNQIYAIFAWIVGGFSGFALTAWWYYYLWITWSSPLFPLYNRIFQSPLFPLENFRDTRWAFENTREFFTFVAHASLGTAKTSELYFSDPRITIIALLIGGAILSISNNKIPRRILGFLIFIGISCTLWAVMFAYQRYLIPIELLFGLLIWILISSITSNENYRNTSLAILVFISLTGMRIPDWGHKKISIPHNKSPFAIELNSHLKDTPATYILLGSPLSYILPYFHPQSQFYGTGLSRNLDNLIKQRIVSQNLLPIRFLLKESDAHVLPHYAATYLPNQTENFRFECLRINTSVDRYLSCEINPRRSYSSALEIDEVFGYSDYNNVAKTIPTKGFSRSEASFRWTEGPTAELLLADCLPNGKLSFTVEASAFASNAGLPFNIKIGKNNIKMQLEATSQKYSTFWNNAEACVRHIEINVPNPTSPQEIGLSQDSRKLGIALQRLIIKRESK